MTTKLAPLMALLCLGMLMPGQGYAIDDPSLTILPKSTEFTPDMPYFREPRRAMKVSINEFEQPNSEVVAYEASPITEESVIAEDLTDESLAEVSDTDISFEFEDRDNAVETANLVEEEEELGDFDKITVNYPNQEIRDILRNIADLFDLNLVIPDALVGNTSIKLRDVTWRQVYDIVLKPVGFTFTEESNIVRVVSLEQINLEPMMIRTFPIRYARASDVAVSLAPIIQGRGGSIQVDQRSNTLIVRDRPSVLQEVDNLLKTSTLDQPALQVMIETKFVEVSYREGGDETEDAVGFNWWANGALFGVDNNFLRVLGQLDFFDNFGGSQLATAIFSNTQYNMVLQALKTTRCANLVASPTVVTLNNELATFHVGTNQPIIEANFDETTGTFTVGEVDYLPIGVRLDVTPRINAGADQITLSVKPKVSSIEDELAFSGAGNGLITYPIEAIRETETNVSIKNGYTLALGGLMQDNSTDRIEKVPYLAELPLIGGLFKRKVQSLEKINLIMFITAKTLSPDGATFEEVIDPRLMAKMGVSDDMLPGYWSEHGMEGVESMPESHKRLLKDLRNYRHMNNEMEDQGYLTEQMLNEQNLSFAKKFGEPKKPKSPRHKRSHARRARGF